LTTFNECRVKDPIGECLAKCMGDPACISKCSMLPPPPPPDASNCTRVNEPLDWCTPPPRQQNGDCTFAQTSCKAPVDCVDTQGFPLPGYWCNGAVGKCFDMGSSCVGTPCAQPGDCAAGEACDPCVHTCVKLR
jgi:hypothetical protein